MCWSPIDMESLVKYFPNINKGEWRTENMDGEREGICFNEAIGAPFKYFDVWSFEAIHPDIPLSRHISSWQRALANYGFCPGRDRPNIIALVLDNEGYVFHACRRQGCEWVSKMGMGAIIIHERLSQIVGGLYGNRVQIFSCL